MSSTSAPSHPIHLDPSELGTKEYWDRYYQNDLDNDDDADDPNTEDDDNDNNDNGNGNSPPDPSELESWFDDVGAPAKTLAFLTSTTFPLSPNYTGPTNSTTSTSTSTEPQQQDQRRPAPTVLDLGTGNGSALFSLRLEGGYTGPMVGVDYSSQSIELARKLARQYFSSSSSATASVSANISFHVLDLITDDPTTQSWWPVSSHGFDLVLDKGTFDAISLSSATVQVPTDPTYSHSTTTTERRVCELYPSKVLSMVKPGGFLLVTSCNWTEDEVVAWFTGPTATGSDDSKGRFEVYDTIKYPVFEFGGQKGQGVASVCFRKVIS
ncbi:Protein-lysine N-methyltransferase efm4 [Exophiala dermatitidis]|uniref:Protein-lysine N-methyltransferase EFM4 n=2 Tax=Exophiala dermatitidis TaxID=5970 RepID=H6BXS1_EXODN|nr:uncharacterized protein HMPREF1120_05449 [Exophiala dermatitidis NIH/UT8656]KAJ4516702.1 Protein-lysine N-methyltransferase efm4 [Exophiala dermatitidis]EHY57411.1 hypothetical protein HMPREF1120_05449 [Exophiala dermatitidis NIH/UT8656]KAJ4520673.1 Protein-lysine N-methyltransferase efm4 [Exophiala dermatitidis]KAJ4521815.1 Protein-lysine N-methyltransferase efm4 [Exophiala dermatitidis]KAJ4537683.1 Protein-lysine N-methyltransferase efm4 [Exophiala dermatitidis]